MSDVRCVANPPVGTLISAGGSVVIVDRTEDEGRTIYGRGPCQAPVGPLVRAERGAWVRANADDVVRRFLVERWALDEHAVMDVRNDVVTFRGTLMGSVIARGESHVIVEDVIGQRWTGHAPDAETAAVCHMRPRKGKGTL